MLDMDMPMELLNALTPPGMPDHRLLLKVGMLLVMVKDMGAHQGLANGARLILRKVVPYILEVETELGNRTPSAYPIQFHSGRPRS